jgi:ABC-type transporter Mla MlaB component
MKRHLRLSSMSSDVHEHEAGQALVAGGAATAAAPRPAHLALVSTPPWSHTLILTGRLNEDSAPELEDEIECLREEGVSSLTLDLRRLEAVDESALEVIASQGASFRSSGRRFAVLGQAGVRAGLRLGDGPELESWETTMVRELGVS